MYEEKSERKRKRKLLVIDLNGLLVDTFRHGEGRRRPRRRPDGNVYKKAVYKRPFCQEFIEFCLENFDVGIWSSSKSFNVDGMVDIVFGKLRRKLMFVWYQDDCTDTGKKVPGNHHKPLFLKELSKLWNREKPDITWEDGGYGAENTLLIDDSPYKALRNPPYTAIFPDPYEAVTDESDDILGGSLKSYLEGLLLASNVQQYVQEHQYGQKAICDTDPDWHIYRQVLSNPLDRNSNNLALQIAGQSNNLANGSTLPGSDSNNTSEKNHKDVVQNGQTEQNSSLALGTISDEGACGFVENSLVERAVTVDADVAAKSPINGASIDKPVKKKHRKSHDLHIVSGILPNEDKITSREDNVVEEAVPHDADVATETLEDTPGNNCASKKHHKKRSRIKQNGPGTFSKEGSSSKDTVGTVKFVSTKHHKNLSILQEDRETQPSVHISQQFSQNTKKGGCMLLQPKVFLNTLYARIKYLIGELMTVEPARVD